MFGSSIPNPNLTDKTGIRIAKAIEALIPSPAFQTIDLIDTGIRPGNYCWAANGVDKLSRDEIMQMLNNGPVYIPDMSSTELYMSNYGVLISEDDASGGPSIILTAPQIPFGGDNVGVIVVFSSEWTLADIEAWLD